MKPGIERPTWLGREGFWQVLARLMTAFLLMICSGLAFDTASALTPKQIAVSQILHPGKGIFLFQDRVLPEGTAMRVFYYQPKNFAADTPIVIALHGADRNAEGYVDSGAETLAEAHHFFIIAPEYSSTLFPTARHYNHGNVRTKPEDQWTYFVNDRIFHFVKKKTGSRREKYILVGLSAGSQFVHRQLTVGASKFVAKAFAANAGEYTMPVVGDDPFPYSLTGLNLNHGDLAVLFSSNLFIMLGEADIQQDAYFPKNSACMKQGSTRLERGKRYYETARKEAGRLGLKFNWKLFTFPGVGHTLDGMVKTIVDQAFSVPEN